MVTGIFVERIDQFRRAELAHNTYLKLQKTKESSEDNPHCNKGGMIADEATFLSLPVRFSGAGSSMYADSVVAGHAGKHSITASGICRIRAE